MVDPSGEPGWEELTQYLYAPISIQLAMDELGNALLKKVRKNELKEAVALTVIKRSSSIFRFVEQRTLLTKSFEIARKHEISIYDALFIAAAMKTGYELVTCDKRQAEIARKLGVRTIVY